MFRENCFESNSCDEIRNIFEAVDQKAIDGDFLLWQCFFSFQNFRESYPA